MRLRQTSIRVISAALELTFYTRVTGHASARARLQWRPTHRPIAHSATPRASHPRSHHRPVPLGVRDRVLHLLFLYQCWRYSCIGVGSLMEDTLKGSLRLP